MAVPPPEGPPRPKRLIADEAHDAMTLRRSPRRRRGPPALATRTVPFAPDGQACKRRDAIERLRGRLKNWRRLARNCLAGLALVPVALAWARMSPLPSRKR